jgi:phosphate transport system substrate-binding protein
MEHVNIFRPLWLLIWTVLVPALIACHPPDGPIRPITPTPLPPPIVVGLTLDAAALARWGHLPDGRAAQFVAGNQAMLHADLEAGVLEAIVVPELLPVNGQPPWFTPLVLDGIVLVVHPDNPLQAISLAQAQALFSGEITTWDGVGGENRPILPVIRERGSAMRALFDRRVLAGHPPAIQALIAESPQAMVAAVSADPAAIGMLTFSALPTDPPLRPLQLDGHTPTLATISAQSWPLTTPLWLVARQEPQGGVRALVAWWQSEAGQRVVGEKFGRIR